MVGAAVHMHCPLWPCAHIYIRIQLSIFYSQLIDSQEKSNDPLYTDFPIS